MCPVFGDMAAWVGRLKGSPPQASDGSLGVPKVMRSSPSGENLVMVWVPSSAQ